MSEMVDWVAPEPDPVDDWRDDGAAPWPGAADVAEPGSPAHDAVVVSYDVAWTPADFDGVGTPLADAVHWHEQQSRTSCAIVTQGAVLESIKGIEFDEARLTEMATANGWYHPDRGTLPGDVGKLLEAHGVPCEQRSGADVADLVAALERGDKVLVGVDGAEIAAPWHDATTGAAVEQPDAPHSVWVTGIDTGPDGSVHVLVNDPGHPGGRLAPVELHDFLNAWHDTGNHLTVARVGAVPS